MNYIERKQQLVDEFNQLETRQVEIRGAIKELEELEKNDKETQKNDKDK